MELKIEYRKLADLLPYVNNARTHSDEQVRQLAASIKEFGFNAPVAVDAQGMILCGHGRVMAAKKLGLKEVPTVCLSHLSDTQVKAYILADNKLALNAGWDADLLKIELEDLKESDFDLNLTGFSDDELNSILIDDPTEVKEDKFDGEPPEVAKSQRGDIWTLGEHRLMCGDSTSENDIKCLILEDKIDLVLTDPPYGINAVNSSGTTRNQYEKALVRPSQYQQIIGDDSTDTARKNFEIIRKISDIQVIFGGNYFTDFLPPSRCWFVWDKGQPEESPFAQCELAWVSVDGTVRLFKHLWAGLIREGDRAVEGTKRIHQTQKPVGLCADIIQHFDKVQTVMDCFGGSGSTLIACEKLNRKCRMMEMSEQYVDVIIERWQKLTGKDAVRQDGVKFKDL